MCVCIEVVYPQKIRVKDVSAGKRNRTGFSPKFSHQRILTARSGKCSRRWPSFFLSVMCNYTYSATRATCPSFVCTLAFSPNCVCVYVTVHGNNFAKFKRTTNNCTKAATMPRILLLLFIFVWDTEIFPEEVTALVATKWWSHIIQTEIVSFVSNRNVSMNQ